jgi:Fe-S oxidoreductase
MTLREGNLEAPTRHPIDWQGADYYDEAKTLAEMERVFDICHGCRRCVSLCQSFPNLFDLVDATADGEVHGVDKKDYAKVVDQCYLCDLCYMTKCPYVPPHPWQVDFPHLMLRAKAIKYRKGEVGAARSCSPRPTCTASSPASRSSRRSVNAANRTKPVRKVLDARSASIPTPGCRRWRRGASAPPRRSRTARPKVVDGERSPGKVAVFSTCFVNYNEPGIGHDLLKVLRHNGIPYEVVEKESCCGMPKLELGDLEGVARHKEANIPVLARYAKEGWAIVSAVPSCTLMFKQELPLMFPGDADVKAVQEAMFDPFEYLVARHRDGLLKTDFKTPLGKVSYHVPCHGRVQKIGRKTEEMFKLIGKTVAVELNTVERCSGHAGTYGVKTPTHPVAMKIGTPVFKAMANGQPAFISSDCPMAGHHIAQGMDGEQAARGGAAPSAQPGRAGLRPGEAKP